MVIRTDDIVSITQANQNFSQVARQAEKTGQVVIFKNNRPKYLVVDLESNPPLEMSDDEKVAFIAARIINQHRAAFEELAK